MEKIKFTYIGGGLWNRNKDNGKKEYHWEMGKKRGFVHKTYLSWKEKRQRNLSIFTRWVASQHNLRDNRLSGYGKTRGEAIRNLKYQ